MSDARSSDPRAGRSESRSHLRALPSPEVDTTDWPAQAADTIERAVQSVRDKTTGPAINVARWVVAGAFGLIVGTAILILLAITAIRVLDAYLPDAWFGEDHIWAVYGILGIISSGFGLELLRRRHPKDH